MTETLITSNERVKENSAVRFIIYIHRNLVTGKAYIGQTKRHRMQDRWDEHVKNAKVGRGCRLLSCAIRKYGADSFEHEVLAVVATQSEADIAEAAWIAQHSTVTPGGYNLDSGRYQGAGRSFHHSEETKRLMSEKAKAREARMSPEERRAHRLGASTPEERSETARRRWASITPDQRERWRANISAALSSSARNTAAVRARWACMTPEQRSEVSRKTHAAQTPEQRSARQRKGWASMSVERRAEVYAAQCAAAAARRKPRGPNGRKIGCTKCKANVEVSSGSWCLGCWRIYHRGRRHVS